MLNKTEIIEFKDSDNGKEQDNDWGQFVDDWDNDTRSDFDPQNVYYGDSVPTPKG